MDEMFKQVLRWSKELADLPSNVIWALGCLILALREVARMKLDQKLADIREKQADGDTAMAEAIDRLSQKVAEQSIVISERIPRRD